MVGRNVSAIKKLENKKVYIKIIKTLLPIKPHPFKSA